MHTTKKKHTYTDTYIVSLNFDVIAGAFNSIMVV